VTAEVIPISERTPRFSVHYEIELRTYFSLYLPSAPGDQSGFGAMCRRLGNSRSPRSNERPTPGTPWTEIVDCPRTYVGASFDGEEAMLTYLDARRRFRRVCEALSRLSERDQAALNAYYGAEPTEHPLERLADVACLTQTAWARNRSRAARGVHEPIEATVRWLAAATAPDARAAFEDVNREATAMVATAKANYARARRAMAAA
jgi:hypothetical protein